MKKTITLTTVFLSLIFPLDAISQFTPDEMAARPEIEKLLRTSKITRSTALKDGITKPYRLFLASEGEDICDCWKSVTGSPKGYIDEWRFEIDV